MSDKKIPTPEEIQKEFEKLLKDKFGGQVHLTSVNSVPTMPTRPMEPQEPPQFQETRKVKQKEILDFALKPKQVKEFLDKNVIYQDSAKRALAIAICDHYNHVKDALKNGSDVNYAKQNVLMLGPTGVGKTYLIREVAKLIGVPFVKADATRFSETGYVGANVDDMIRDLVQQANGDIELAQYGIIYLDEADKLASAPSRGRDVTGRGVQFGLLKLMEETEVDLRSGNDMASQMKNFMDMQTKGKVTKEVINTRHILFIVSGAFNGLKEIIEKRETPGTLGLGGVIKGEVSDNDLFEKVVTSDLIEFGFEPEFVGRLPVRVVCHELSEDHLFEILKNSGGSIVKQYVRSFAAYGIQLSFTDEALKLIAKKAAEEKTGARGLVTVLEGLLRSFKFELPSSGVRTLEVTAELVTQPLVSLDTILRNDRESLAGRYRMKFQEFENEFKNKHRLQIRLTPEARELIAKKSEESKRDIASVCEEALQYYEHGLSLIFQRRGQEKFEITEEVVRDPKGTMERWIKESYS